MFLVEGTADANAVGVRADGGSGPAGERLLAAFPRATAGVRVQVLGEKHVMEDYHIWHVDNVGMPGLGHPTFLGVPVQKSLNNLWKTQEILHELRPGFIVKFGWLRGGLALYYTNTIAYSDDTGRPGPFEAASAVRGIGSTTCQSMGHQRRIPGPAGPAHGSRVQTTRAETVAGAREGSSRPSQSHQ